MDYLNKLSTNAPIQNAVQLIKQFPVTHRLTDMYKRSSKNELMFVGAATFITLYNLSAYIKAKRQRLNLPPMAAFSLPLVGHGLYLMLMPNRFIDWCIKTYGEVYTINMFGKTITVTSGKAGEEALKADTDDLSLDQGIVRDLLHLDYVCDEVVMDMSTKVNPVVAKAALANSKMSNLVPGIQFGLENAAKVLLSEKVTYINHPSDFLQSFVAYMSVPSLVGDEFALNKEVIKSFAGFTNDVIKNVGIFLAVPKFLHKLVLPYVQSAHKHNRVMEEQIAPVIAQRREKMKAAAQAGVEHGLPDDFLQGLIEFSEIDEEGNTVSYSNIQVAHAVLMVAFASVHTTSMNLSFSLYWLLARPDLKAQLMEEIQRVCPGKSPITHEELSQMKFLNNFMREVLRQGSDSLGHGKKAMRDYTFSNGYQVPKGQMVEVNLRQMNFGLTSNRSEVDDMNPTESMDRISTTPARDFVTFGMGKHLCPGRFFAVQEIQMSLVYLLKNFDIKVASGKRPVPVKRMGGVMVVNCEDPLVFTAKN